MTKKVSSYYLSLLDIDRYFSLLKRQIKDGTSLLYDLSPLYISINLGEVGMSTSKQLKDFHIVKKKGIVVSLNS